MNKQSWLCALLLIPALIAGAAVRAQESYPSQPIRLVLPGPPGNVTDLMARVLGKAVGDSLGQLVVVENKPGGATIIATEQVVRSKPDGHTLLMISAPFVTNPGLYAKLPYDGLRDLSPVILSSSNGFIIAVNENQSWRSLLQLVEAARKPGASISYASPGIGTVMHLAGQLFNTEYGAQFVNVAYKGSADAVRDVSAGHVPVIIDPIATTLAMIKQGKLRALAVSHPTRQPELPEVATVRELGFPKIEVRSFSGFMVPAGTPHEIVMKLNAAFRNAIANPEIRKQLTGQNLVSSTPEEFGAMLKTETDRWVPLIRKLGIRAE